MTSCYVQKNSEFPVSPTEEVFLGMEITEDMVEVIPEIASDENNAEITDALTSGFLLINFPKEREMSRWEDDLSYIFNKTDLTGGKAWTMDIWER